VAVYIHGGGWTGGEATANASQPRWLADHGWFVVSIDYRLASPGNPTWDKGPADVGCALAWTAARARSSGADTSRFVVLGDSAGGNLALQVGWAAALGRAPSTCPELGAVPVPNAIVVTYPIANPLDASEHGRPFLRNDPRAFTSTYLGGAPSEFPDRLAAISPETYISARAPATLVIQADRDDFIPAAGNYAVAEEARAGGVDVTVVRLPFTHHGFDGYGNSLGWQAKLTIAEAWLRDHGLAPNRTASGPFAS